VPNTRSRTVRRKQPSVTAIAAELKEHRRRLDRLEALPDEMKVFKRKLLHEFALLREDVTAPLGRLELDQRSSARLLMGLAEKAGVEVPAPMRARFGLVGEDS